MLMNEYDEWRSEQSADLQEIDEDNFSIFFQQRSFGKTFVEMMALLAYEIYELQVCMEGVVEDMDQ